MACPPTPVLTASQERAIAVIRARAVAKRVSAVQTIEHIFRMSNIPLRTLDELRAAVQTHAGVAVHFHPDRPVNGSGSSSQRTVARALLEEGIYRNQFETGISNGGVSAFTGGARDQWERALFAGVYHGADVADIAALRPKYGALDLVGASDGPAPRFGCCYLVLKPSLAARTTLTFGGSQDGPARVGTADELDDVLAAVLEECFVRDAALGIPDIRPAALVARILTSTTAAWRRRSDRTPPPTSRNLDHYVEAQIHGPLRLAHDVAAVVVDPSFRGTPTGADLAAMAAKYAFSMVMHPGFRIMAAAAVPVDFRGPTMPSLAARICPNGTLDAAAIGAAVCDLHRNGAAWADRGTPAEVLQELKLLWHVLVRYGEPILDDDDDGSAGL